MDIGCSFEKVTTETVLYAAPGLMGPILRLSHSGLFLVSLFLRCESLLVSSMFAKERRGLSNICSDNQGACQKGCPSGWMFYNDNCYGVFDGPLTWSAAEVDCQNKKREAHLASFLNQKELKEMAKYLSSSHRNAGHIWIGLYDPRESGNWRWVDLSIASFLPWDVGEPNNAYRDEYCGHLAAQTGFEKMNDASCSLEMAYLCKYPL